MKKSMYIVLILFLLVFACIRAPQDKPDDTVSKATSSVSYRSMTWQEGTDIVPFVFTGVCRAVDVKTDASDRGTIVIALENVLQGEIKETEIVARSRDYGYFIIGGKYLMFARKTANVFIDEEDYYLLNEVIALDGTDFPTHAFTNVAELQSTQGIELVQTYVSSRIFPGDDSVSGDYIRSDDPDEIYKKSGLVVFGRVVSIENDTFSDRTIYVIETTDTAKGHAEQRISVAAPKQSLMYGAKYLFFLNKSGDNGVFYVISSKHSIYDEYSAEFKKMLSGRQ